MRQIDWLSLREKYFRECVGQRVVKENGYPVDHMMWVKLAPHDLFEWFRKNIEMKFTEHK